MKGMGATTFSEASSKKTPENQVTENAPLENIAPENVIQENAPKKIPQLENIAPENVIQENVPPENATIENWFVDSFRPLVIIFSPLPFEYWSNESLTVDFKAVDFESGVGRTLATLDGMLVYDNQKINLSTLGLGQHTLTVSATDKAGNKSTDSVTFIVAEPPVSPTIPEEKTIIKKLEEKIQKFENKLANIEKITKQISQLQEKVKKLQAKLAQEEELKLKIERLENQMLKLGGMESRIFELEQAIEKGTVGGSISFGGAGTEVEFYTPQVAILAVAENENNRLVVVVSSEVPEGKTIVINIENWIMLIKKLNELKVTYDGKPVELADNYSDVLNPENENVPEYLAVLGKKGVQVLVSIPKFSTHEIVISKKALTKVPIHKKAAAPWAMLISAIAIIAVFSGVVAYRMRS